jgi:hypothetical protein
MGCTQAKNQLIKTEFGGGIMNDILDQLAPIAGLFGLLGFAGLAGLKRPIDKSRSGTGVRLMGLLGLAGLAGIWIPGAGAMGAAGALGLWNHQNPRLALWGKLGWTFLLGVPYLVRALVS